MSDAANPSTPAAAPPAAPAFQPLPLPRAFGYIAAGVVIALTQGLAQGFVSTNIPQIAGDLGATTTQASWLMAAFLIPRASMPILLIKLRAQYGLRRFCEVAIVVYLAVSLISFAALDLRSAVTTQFFAGMASAPLSTLAFLYILEPLPPAWKMRLGLPMVLSLVAVGPNLARVISPALMNDAGWSGLHMMALGMAAISLGLVYLMPLKSPPRVKVIAPLDLVSWVLIVLGFGGLVIGCTMGPTFWWTEVAWLGWVMAGSIICLTLAVVIELHRAEPLVDIRWLVSPAMLHLTVALLIFRLILSEQSAGAPRMFQLLGITQGQLVSLFAVISAAGILGGIALIPWMKPNRVPLLHLIALILIAAGAYMDSRSTTDTVPAQMMLSQGLIAFAGSLFMAPAMMRGLMAALARGPNYLLSFVIVFLSTQSIGGAAGSGLFTTFINHSQAYHLQVLREDLQSVDPLVLREVAMRAAQLAPQVTDAAQGRAQAAALIAQDATNQAYVMAYNDAYFLTCLAALAAAAALLLHLGRDWLAERWQRYQATPPIPEPLS
ncbi:MAG TPA: MFS transporter [Paracoccus sp. (in: a-proteobacteria)]|uniref:MFS transporter n=1 Tax=Paracoccus sp. TaxID=267 RepID=UPI002B5E1044|nr:MFS transporter [Paracoccus sp. (in: a-proteobacteria)]HWL55953.1 MFS transporter [Paracoccus sp. (in: a-proteobacteria)]